MRISDWSSDVCSSDLQRARIWQWRRHLHTQRSCGASLRDRGGGRDAWRQRARSGSRGTSQLRRPPSLEIWRRSHVRARCSTVLYEDEDRVAAMAGARAICVLILLARLRSEEHTSELQSLMRISYAVFCLKKKKT